MSRLLKSVVGAAAVLTAFALVGCASDEPSNASGPEKSESSAKQEPTQPAKEAATELLTPSACLVGEWVGDNARFAELLHALAQAEGGVVEGVTGQVILTLGSDGQTNTAYTDWTIKMNQEGMALEIVRNGTDRGTYVVGSETALTMTETGSDSELVMRMNGADAGTVPATNTLPVTEAGFTCSSDLLTIDTPDAVIEFTRQ